MCLKCKRVELSLDKKEGEPDGVCSPHFVALAKRNHPRMHGAFMECIYIYILRFSKPVLFLVKSMKLSLLRKPAVG